MASKGLTARQPKRGSAKRKGAGRAAGDAEDAAPSSPFRPINNLKAAHEAVAQLTFAILSGWYEVGDRLPIIPELSKAMKVSPPVVGEAIRILSDAGVLEVRRGSQGGITVKSAYIPVSITESVRPLRAATTLAPIVEARRPVEIEIIRLAAVRATDETLNMLEKNNARLVLARGEPRPWTQAHNAFHYGIGRAAGNPLLAHFQHELLEEMAVMLHDYDERFMEPDRTIREHQETLEALRTRDPEVAVEAMSRHLLEFEELAEHFEARNGAA